MITGYDIKRRTAVIDRWFELESTKQADPMAALNDPATMRSLLLGYTEKVITLENKVEELAPKARFHDEVAVAPDAISIAQAAKTLNTGRNRLCSFMRQQGWMTRHNEPYQDKINSGLLDVKISKFMHPENGLQQSITTLVTGKGLTKLSKLLSSARTAA